MQYRFAGRTAILLASIMAAGCASNVETPADTVQPSATTATATVQANLTVPTEIATQQPGLLRAWQGTDPLAIRSYYADHAVVITPTTRYTGWKDIHARWVVPNMKVMSEFTATPAAFTRSGNDIIETGTYSFRANQGGQVQDMKGAYIHRWQRMADGSWLVVSASVQ